jgi:quinol monooxygenase YgiN
MITVMVRLRAESWERFKRAHDAPHHIQRRRNHGNLSHAVLNQLDDATDIVYLDTWSSPQDSDEFYHSDEFHRELEQMGGDVIEIIKLEETDATSIGGQESG